MPETDYCGEGEPADVTRCTFSGHAQFIVSDATQILYSPGTANASGSLDTNPISPSAPMRPDECGPMETGPAGPSNPTVHEKVSPGVPAAQPTIQMFDLAGKPETNMRGEVPSNPMSDLISLIAERLTRSTNSACLSLTIRVEGL